MEKIIFDLHQDLLPFILDKKLNAKDFFKINVVSVFTLIKWKSEFIENYDINFVLRAIETYREFAEKNNFLIVEKASDLKSVMDSKRKGFIIDLECCSVITDKYILKALFNLGVRVFTLTWNYSNQIASSCGDIRENGLTKFGKEIVNEIAEIGGIVDLAHSGRKTFYDVYKMKVPFFVSHTGILKNPKNKRNISFIEMDLIKNRKSIAGIALGSLFFERKINKEEVIKKIKALLRKYPENISLGSDLFGLSERNIIEGFTSYEQIRESLKDLPDSFLYLNAYNFFIKHLPEK
ncbi:MAG: membrane dipeptidase [Candidatus Hydrothermales bacterium]